MAEQQDSSKQRKRRKKLTDSARKSVQRSHNILVTKRKVFIGNQIDRWDRFKARLGIATNPEMAAYLLDRLEAEQEYEVADVTLPYEITSEVADVSTAMQQEPTEAQVKQDRILSSTPSTSHAVELMELSESDVRQSSATDGSGPECEIEKKEEESNMDTEFSRPASSNRMNSFIYSFTDSDVGSDQYFDGDDDIHTPSVDIRLGSTDEENFDEMETTFIGDDEFEIENDDDGQNFENTAPGLCHIQEPEDVIQQNTCLAYEQCLIDLAKSSMGPRCHCGKPFSITAKKVATAMYLDWVCEDGHVGNTWGSQPIVQKVQAGDLLMSSAIMLSGNNYSKINLLSKFMKLGMVNHSTHYAIQRNYTIPVINSYWERLNSNVLESLEGEEVIIAGDGRNDSPGHSAVYCTYTVMDVERENILAVVVVDKRQCALKSTNMEKLGLEKALDYLLSKGIKVKEVVTDQHLQIGALLKRKYPTLGHSFDIWHVAKNMAKKLNQAGLQSGNEPLLAWAGDVVNHFWHCAEQANGNCDRFFSTWRGVLHHVTGQHEWLLTWPDESGQDAKCSHEPLINENKEKLLEARSPPHVALGKIVLDKRFINNIKHFVNFRHTGLLESINNHQLMYAGKRFAYQWPAYKARCLLACIDYQMHKERGYQHNQDGSLRKHRLYKKRTNTWTVTTRKNPKTYLYVNDMIKEIVLMRLEDTQPLRRRVELDPQDPRRIAPTIAKIPPPPTAELVAGHRTRFSTE